MAMDFASLARLAGPRVIAGVGAGVRARLKRIGVEAWHPVEVVAETVGLLRALLSGEEPVFGGIVHRATGLRLDIPLPPRLPIYVAAVGPRALAQAGRIADGVVLTLMCSVPHARAACETIRAASRDAGRIEHVPTVAYVPMSTADHADAAVRQLKPLMAYYIQRWAPIPSLRTLFTDWGPLDERTLAEVVAALAAGAPPETVIEDGLVRTYCVAGTPDDCRRQLASLADAGVSVVAIGPGEIVEEQDKVVSVLGRLAAARGHNDGG